MLLWHYGTTVYDNDNVNHNDDDHDDHEEEEEQQERDGTQRTIAWLRKT